MRGEGLSSTMDVRAAMLWLDLQAAGVHAEMAEVPFDWFGRAPKQEQRSGGTDEPPIQVAEAATVEVRVAPLMPRVQEQRSGGAQERGGALAVEAVAAAGRVWTEGECGKTVVVVEQEGVLAGRARELLVRMLASVGIGEGEVSWVGFVGVVQSDEIRAALAGMAPARVLVLGQNPLAALLGRKLGVEGWQASPAVVLEGVPTGVTYPPALLLAQPLFKRLAWQHLLAWKMGWVV